jgi:hypothetical protein
MAKTTAKRKKKKVDKDVPTEKELALRAKWAARTDDTRRFPKKSTGIVKFDTSNSYPDSPFQALAPVATAVDTSLYCSFCKEPVPVIEATIGKKLAGMTQVLNISDPNLRLEERFVLFNRKIVACKKCCLKIKPTVDKAGSVRSNVVFTSLEDC